MVQVEVDLGSIEVRIDGFKSIRFVIIAVVVLLLVGPPLVVVVVGGEDE